MQKTPNPAEAQPIVCRANLLTDVINALVLWTNPTRHRRELPVLRYHKIIAIYPYPFLVKFTQLFSWIKFIHDWVCILTGSPG